MQENKRVRGQVHQLRAAVLLDESLDPELQLGYLESSLFDDTKGCDTMLIVGTSLKTKAAYDLVCELASTVHDSEGAVIYIEQSDLKVSRFGRFVDFHLKVDLQECCAAIGRTMDQVRYLYLTVTRPTILIVYRRICKTRPRTFGSK